jgi:hypothetical protein
VICDALITSLDAHDTLRSACEPQAGTGSDSEPHSVSAASPAIATGRRGTVAAEDPAAAGEQLRSQVLGGARAGEATEARRLPAAAAAWFPRALLSASLVQSGAGPLGVWDCAAVYLAVAGGRG